MGLLNKDNIIKGMNLDNDSKIIVFNLLDKVEQVIKNHEICYFGFISPELEVTVNRILRGLSNEVAFTFYGGYESSEYTMVAIYQDYVSEEELDMPISLLHITTTNKNYEPAHRDVLGSIMGLGIKRETVGDIVIKDKLIQVFVHKSMVSYISANLSKVGRNTCNITEMELEQFLEADDDYMVINETVKSLRLDAVISSGFNVSRSEAAKFISSSKVKINYVIADSPSKQVKQDDLISCRGKGRLRISEIGDLTRKDRIRIEMKKYS